MLSGNSSIKIQTISVDEWLKQTDNEKVYILVESAINSDVPEIAQSNYSFEKTCLYWGEMAREHASISPYLIELLDWDVFANTFAFQPSWGVIIRLTPTVILAENAQQRLLQHLREWTLIESEDNEQMLLRISDFEVIKVLLQASSPQETNNLFGPVLEYAYWQEGQPELEVVSFDEHDTESLQHRSPQRLSQQQSLALHQFANRHQFQKYVQHLQIHHPQLKQWQPDALIAFVDRNLALARHYQFSIERDLVRYLSLAVLFGEDFHQQSWSKVDLESKTLEGAKSRMDSLYQRALEQMDEESES